MITLIGLMIKLMLLPIRIILWLITLGWKALCFCGVALGIALIIALL